MTIESILLTIRTNMIAGGGRVDFSTSSDYTAAGIAPRRVHCVLACVPPHLRCLFSSVLHQGCSFVVVSLHSVTLQRS